MCVTTFKSRSSSSSIPYYFSTTMDTVNECVSVNKIARIGFAVGSVLSVCINIDTTGGSELCVCLFVLRFYGPVNPMGSCRARSVYLTTRLLGRLSPLSG